MEFCKFHGFGNDYIVIERDNIADPIDLSRLAKAICHRHEGVGSDGIAILKRTEAADADFFCEIVNPDGSIAGFSGNGTRCAAAYLHHKGLWNNEILRLETRSGVKRYRFLERGGETYWFEAEIGRPRFGSDEVPVVTDIRRVAVVNEPFELDGRTYSVSAVNVGNPVACIYVDNFDFDWLTLGRKFEVHPRFPNRANIVFVRVIDRNAIELRIWERGAGETAASGTCASGAAVLSSFLLKTERRVNVLSPGGLTEVIWREDDEIVIKGCAEFVFCGDWPAV
ncbi:MAG: diaminopimelate epimerase [Acidobacteria bacterium]|nr:diaminopimelate epimerase [Acidobacteriota bacterium]